MSSQKMPDEILVPLNWKAFSTVLSALRLELHALRQTNATATDENVQADTGNDICYLETLLAELEERYRQKYELSRQTQY